VRILLTGASGFAGPVVAEALAAGGHTVHGFARHPPDPGRAPAMAFHPGDVRDAVGLARVVAEVAPDAVVHLAAVSEPAAAEADPPGAYAVNLGGTLALLAAARAASRHPRLLVVSSGAVYGAVRPAELPVTEDAPLRPVTVYGASKAAAELAALQCARAYGLDVVIARPFNHTGPGQSPAYLCAALASQVAAIEAGTQPPVLTVGNVDPVRDWSDVRDVASGYLALLEQGRGGATYNLCTGDGVSVADIIAQLRSLARVPMRARIDPARRRSNDVERLVGSHARATADTGWAPRIALLDTLATVLEDWRRRRGRGASEDEAGPPNKTDAGGERS
jgi:GDP-4-dehydro-6-deoxy-D-mannose reductase